MISTSLGCNLIDEKRFSYLTSVVSINSYTQTLFIKDLRPKQVYREKEKPPQAEFPFEEAFAKGGNSDKVRLIPSRKI